MSPKNQSHTAIQKRLTGQGSALRKYRLAVMGDKGYFLLFLYEVVVFVTGSLPGSLGSKIRQVFFSMFLGQAGRAIVIGQDCSIRKPHCIRLESNVVLGDRVCLDVKSNESEIHLMTGVCIGNKSILSCPGGQLHIGRRSRIGRRCRLGSLQGLNIGQDCVIGDEACIVGAGHAYVSLQIPIIEQPLTCKGKTVLGDRVIVGRNVTILDGVSIGSDVRIKSGSLVNMNISANSAVSGVPARCR